MTKKIIIGSEAGQKLALEAYKEKQSISKGLLESFSSLDSKDIPFYGTAKEGLEYVKVLAATTRYKAGNATEEDLQVIQDYNTKQIEEAEKND